MAYSKFKNVSTKCARGHYHPSKLESAVCGLIYWREQANEITLIKTQDNLNLGGWYKFIPDFKVQDLKTGEIFWIEAKGSGGGRWPSTRKAWINVGLGKLEVWKGDWKRPYLAETLITKGKE